MNASEPSTSTDWSRADAYANRAADYEELPELDDSFFERAEWNRGSGDRPVAFSTALDETARILRLREAIIEIWGRVAYDVKGLKKRSDGALLLLLEPTAADDD